MVLGFFAFLLRSCLPQIVNDVFSETCVRITKDERLKMKALFSA